MRAFVETGTILDRILARTASDLAARKRAADRAALERMAEGGPARLSLREALREPGISVIAEFKRASPSRGRFPVEVDPDVVARDYINGGAAAISVLTDEPFFQGSLADLAAVAATVSSADRRVPMLRKDFAIDEFQLLEAKAYGADAVLLIVAALDDATLRRLREAAERLDLEALVEVHDDVEMRRAVDSGATLIGINNRDLRTFEVDLAVTERLAPLAPGDAVIVGESGIFTRADAVRMEMAGAGAVLVGESLIVAPDRAAAVRALRTDGAA